MTAARASASAGTDPGAPGDTPARAHQRRVRSITTHIPGAATIATHSMPRARSRCLTWASSWATTRSTWAGSNCSSSVSYRTTRFVCPSPPTYALAAVVRREASTTSTSPTSTPARSASCGDRRPRTARRQVLVAVEQGVHDHRREPHEHDLDRNHGPRARQPPASREPAHQADEQGRAGGRQRRRDRPGLRAVGNPSSPVLRGQAHVGGALVCPCAERQGDDLKGEHHARPDERGPDERAVSPETLQPRDRAPRRPRHQHDQHRSPRDQPADPDQTLQAPEVVGALQLGGAEVGRLRYRQWVDHAVRAQQPHRRLCHQHGDNHGGRQGQPAGAHGDKIGAGRGTPPGPER